VKIKFKEERFNEATERSREKRKGKR